MGASLCIRHPSPRAAADQSRYYNTDGLGLHEYFNWVEDLDLEPVYAVWSGEYLDGQITAQSALEPYIQDALNQIEYITGNTSTYYGALRAANGRTQPWKLNWVEIGNEDDLNGGTRYKQRSSLLCVRTNGHVLPVPTSVTATQCSLQPSKQPIPT